MARCIITEISPCDRTDNNSEALWWGGKRASVVGIFSSNLMSQLNWNATKRASKCSTCAAEQCANNLYCDYYYYILWSLVRLSIRHIYYGTFLRTNPPPHVCHLLPRFDVPHHSQRSHHISASHCGRDKPRVCRPQRRHARNARVCVSAQCALGQTEIPGGLAEPVLGFQFQSVNRDVICKSDFM